MGLPSISQMWPNYPQGTKEEVAKVVGGTVGDNITKYDWDTCCIRLSRVLNYSGVPVTGFAAMDNPYMSKTSKVRASKGGDAKWYIYSTYDLRVYLSTRYGQPKKFKGDADESTVSGVPGIIMFGFKHVDLWDGSKVCHLEFFGDPKVKSEGVLIWPTAA
jgi:type VI secretion system (T6SS) effector Tae4 (amidase)